MLRANRPILAFFDSIKSLRVRQLAMILKAGYDPNLMINARGQNGLQFLINYFGATEAHYRLQAPINKSAYLSIAKLLLDSGLDPNAMDLLADETVLFDAIRYNDKEMVALLLNYVDFSLRNKNGETALMCAARFGSKAITRLLLEHLRHLDMDDYFLRQRNRFGLTPLEIARSENLEAAKVITKHLISYGPHTPSAVLARSMSHHSLAALDARRATNFRATPATAAVARASGRALPADVLLDEYVSPSDYDEDATALMVAAAAGTRRPTVLEATAMGAAARRRPYVNSYQAYYDPKAAEFSQYLLEQQQQQQQQHGAGRRATAANLSDDDQDDAAADYGLGARSGPLLRSRSCMLGPAGSSSSGAGGPASKKLEQQVGGGGGAGAAGSSKMGATWQDQSSGGGGQ